MQWFANVDGQIYGPYTDALMQSYVSEGRITDQSLISNNPPEGFFPAISFDIFSFWAGTGQAQASGLGGAQTVTAHNHAAFNPVQTQPMQTEQPENTASAIISPFRRTRQAQQDIAPSERPNSSASASALNVFIVMAEIRSENLMTFLTDLQQFGRTERIGDSLWLVKSEASADTLRNALSQTLTRQDRMFIVDCTQNKTAWFNIGADLDSRIRAIWDG